MTNIRYGSWSKYTCSLTKVRTKAHQIWLWDCPLALLHNLYHKGWWPNLIFSEMVSLTDNTKLSTDVKTSSNVPGSKILGPAIGAGAMLLFLVLALVVVKVCQQTITYYVQALLSTIILPKHVLVKEFTDSYRQSYQWKLLITNIMLQIFHK